MLRIVEGWCGFWCVIGLFDCGRWGLLCGVELKMC